MDLAARGNTKLSHLPQKASDSFQKVAHLWNHPRPTRQRSSAANSRGQIFIELVLIVALWVTLFGFIQLVLMAQNQRFNSKPYHSKRW